ncbi:RcpC/CpaB family pilus assembly protein, partial [Pandoraea pnomenusa]|uniref:RcpC/CpaB family pilus assembly protein n=1 Tax=Pandoraea pnomenusa TaxID=93220 RepID=UPI001AC116AB
ALAPGVALTQGTLAHGLSLQLAPGERAVAIPVTETVGVSNRIRPGDYVDVFFTLKTNQAGPNGAVADDTQARLLASRVRVLTYGNASLDDVTPPPASPGVASTVQAVASTAPPPQPASNPPPVPATSAVVAGDVRRGRRAGGRRQPGNARHTAGKNHAGTSQSGR